MCSSSAIEAILGPIVADGAPCGRITPAGDCMGASTAVWCDESTGLIASETCEGGAACGWDADAAGYRCVTDDPCMGISATGACQGDTAVWCDEGTVRRRDCGACDEASAATSATSAASTANRTRASASTPRASATARC